MKTKKLLGLLVLFVLTGLFGAKAQPVVHPKAYYDAISYEWTDATGVSHSNAITDEATNPYQIVALLKKVYCDPNIPGPRYTAYDQDGNREREVYYGPIEGGWNISASDVTPPYEEGYTILMVALNNNITRIGYDMEQMISNSWLFGPSYKEFKSNFFTSTNELIDYISNNVTAVQLLCDGLRVGNGTLAGTTFNISGDYNRFFVLSKGQSRKKDNWVLQEEGNYDYPVIAGERVPFKSMFEQFSPTDGSEGSQITDFYAKMVGGKLYPVVHDCASVIESEHEFSMSGKDGTEYKSLTGMNIFIPDYRLQYWVNDQFYIHYNNGTTEGPYTVDGRTMNPYKRINGTNFRNPSYLAANYAQYNLDYAPKMGIYNVVLEGNAEPTATEHVYNVILDWTSSLDEMTGESVPQTYTLYLVLTDEDGNEVNQEVTVTGETTYTYEVPQDLHSYTLTYIVYAKPADGEHDMFVAWSNQADVVIPGWYDFLTLDLKNYESDYVSNDEMNYYRNHLGVTNEDAVNALTPERVQNGEDSFTLFRYDAADDNVMVPVANLTLAVNRSEVTYQINYEPQDVHPDYEALVQVDGTLGSYEMDAPLNLENIEFVDQFAAYTADNDHPARYGYVLKLNNATAEKSTNSVEVPVLKTTSTMEGYYTLDEVMADVDANLTAGVKNANVKMTLSTNPAIYYYTLERGNNCNPNETISKLQRRSDGTYREMLDVLPQYFNNEYNPGEVERLDNNVVTGYQNEFMTYQPIIWTFRDDNKENSYGSPIWRNYLGEINGDVRGYHTYTTPTASGEWYDQNGNRCYIYNPIITTNGVLPEGANVNYEPYMFRVWRLCNDVRGYIRDANGKLVNDPEADCSPDKLIAEEITDETTIESGDDNMALAFGATDNADIQFRVRFYYKQTGPNRRGLNDEPKYYIVESILDWINIPTGISEVNASNEVSKTYYNAQGLSSDKPFDGVNIVVTTYSDGSTHTSKVVR